MNVIEEKFDALLRERMKRVREMVEEKEAKKVARAREKAAAAFDDSDAEDVDGCEDGAQAAKKSRLDYGTNKIVNEMKQLDAARNKTRKPLV